MCVGLEAGRYTGLFLGDSKEIGYLSQNYRSMPLSYIVLLNSHL